MTTRIEIVHPRTEVYSRVGIGLLDFSTPEECLRYLAYLFPKQVDAVIQGLKENDSLTWADATSITYEVRPRTIRDTDEGYLPCEAVLSIRGG